MSLRNEQYCFEEEFKAFKHQVADFVGRAEENGTPADNQKIINYFAHARGVVSSKQKSLALQRKARQWAEDEKANRKRKKIDSLTAKKIHLFETVQCFSATFDQRDDCIGEVKWRLEFLPRDSEVQKQKQEAQETETASKKKRKRNDATQEERNTEEEAKEDTKVDPAPKPRAAILVCSGFEDFADDEERMLCHNFGWSCRKVEKSNQESSDDVVLDIHHPNDQDLIQFFDMPAKEVKSIIADFMVLCFPYSGFDSS
jgi:hypothetical protein